MTIEDFTTLISDEYVGKAPRSSFNAAFASEREEKLPTVVYQLGEREKVYTCPRYFGNLAAMAFPRARARA